MSLLGFLSFQGFCGVGDNRVNAYISVIYRTIEMQFGTIAHGLQAHRLVERSAALGVLNKYLIGIIIKIHHL
jgi:hypothetical protein